MINKLKTIISGHGKSVIKKLSKHENVLKERKEEIKAKALDLFKNSEVLREKAKSLEAKLVEKGLDTKEALNMVALADKLVEQSRKYKESYNQIDVLLVKLLAKREYVNAVGDLKLEGNFDLFTDIEDELKALDAEISAIEFWVK